MYDCQMENKKLPPDFFIQTTGDFSWGDDDVTYVNGIYHLYL